MLTKIHFLTKGYLKLDREFSVSYGGRTYDFELDDDGFLATISVVLPIALEFLPTITTTTTDGKVRDHITVPTFPNFEEIVDDLRTLEGLLTFYGLREINFRNVQQEWIPESPDEEKLIQIQSFSIGARDKVKWELEPTPIDLVVRSLIRARYARDEQVAMSFHRKGCQDMDQGRYIDAIYDFFFVLEYLYGRGQFKTKQLKENFCSSSELLTAVSETKQTIAQLIQFRNPDEQHLFANQYLRVTAEGVLNHFVDLRGLLHHHSSKHNGRWHPEEHDPFRLPAMFLQRVTFKVCFSRIREPVFGREADEAMALIQQLADFDK